MTSQAMHLHRFPGTLACVCITFCTAVLSGALRGEASLAITVRTVKGEPVTDAAIALIPLDSQAVPPPANTGIRHEIVQQKEEFIPYVTIVQAGARVEFPNRDSVQHHVYSLSKAKKFELPLYDPGRSESLVFDVSGTVTLGCNIHDWMIAYLIVVPTPYFSKTSKDGTATVSAPPGHYRAELQHPRLSKAASHEIRLEEGKTSDHAFTVSLKPDRRIRRSSDSKSGSYP